MITRRDLLIDSAALLGAGLLGNTSALASLRKKRVLFFTKSSGFEHPMIKRPTGGSSLAPAEQILTDLGKQHGFEVTCTKDGSVFNAAGVTHYDTFAFYTTGDLTKAGTDGTTPMSTEGKAMFLEAIHNGKGFVGVHSATDTFHTEPDPAERYIAHNSKVDPYVEMIGAEFIHHGAQQRATMRSIDSSFPGMAAAGPSFTMLEEWYSLKDFRPNLHVLLVQETDGMKGKPYERGPYPATWARKYGSGNVFYTSMGHRQDVWDSPTFQSILLGGIAWSTGAVKAAVPANLTTAAPHAGDIPPE